MVDYCFPIEYAAISLLKSAQSDEIRPLQIGMAQNIGDLQISPDLQLRANEFHVHVRKS
jgi:hypothetical protein